MVFEQQTMARSSGEIPKFSAAFVKAYTAIKQLKKKGKEKQSLSTSDPSVPSSESIKSIFPIKSTALII